MDMDERKRGDRAILAMRYKDRRQPRVENTLASLGNVIIIV